MKAGKRIPYQAAWLGYISIMCASAGHYGYYLGSADALIYPWLIWLAPGIGLIGWKNFRLKKWGCVCLDVVNILCMAWLPMFSLPYGLSIVGMIIFCSVLIGCMHEIGRILLCIHNRHIIIWKSADGLLVLWCAGHGAFTGVTIWLFYDSRNACDASCWQIVVTLIVLLTLKAAVLANRSYCRDMDSG